MVIPYEYILWELPYNVHLTSKRIDEEIFVKYIAEFAATKDENYMITVQHSGETILIHLKYNIRHQSVGSNLKHSPKITLRRIVNKDTDSGLPIKGPQYIIYHHSLILRSALN